MPETIAALLHQYGYAVVVIGILLENMGIPVPGETVLLAAAFFAQKGYFSLPWVIGLATIAAIIGDNFGYLLGKRWGRDFIKRHRRLFRLTPERMARMDGFFAKHGAKTIFFARFIAGLRVFAALFAGMTKVPWAHFLFYNAAGAITWATIMGLLGYFFGESFGLLEGWIGHLGLVAIVLTVFLIPILLYHYHRRHPGTAITQGKEI